MIVKIIGCNESSWYKDFIGSPFRVYSDKFFDCYILESDLEKFKKRSINKQDVEIIEK